MNIDSSSDPWWHVIWVTFQSWPPSDSRGDWRNLAALYARLLADGVKVECSEPLPDRWQCKPLRPDVVALPAESWVLLADDLKKLSTDDRVAGDSPIQAIVVNATSVQMLLSCPAELLSQRIGRMKSRSSTLLDFRPHLGVGGARTWGRGIWWARIDSEAAFWKVEEFIAKGVHGLDA